VSQPSYAPLVIEYVTEGREGSQRGYSFTSPTRGYSEQDLKRIWQRAMPRGQGWAQYIGARSLKCFGLASGRIAISNVQVTDQQDESGRRGIRRAEVMTFSQGEYSAHLRELWDTLPEGIQNDARFQWDYWRKLRLIESQLGKIRRKNQLILTHRYTSMTDWQVVEGIILYVGLRPSLLPAFSPPFDWTTLALDYQDEGTFVAVPQQVLQQTAQKSAASKTFAIISV
jgi:hypothetical protein